MITSGFSFIGFLIFFSALVFFIEERVKTKTKFFEYVPPLVIIYFSAMIMSSVGVWSLSLNGVKTGAGIARIAIKDAILPSMIFLMLLKCDLRNIRKLGPKMLKAFVCASISILLGFVVAFIIFQDYLGDKVIASKAFASLAGSWVGGTQNMVAVQSAIGLSDSGMGYTLLIDSIDYSIWIMLLIFFVSNNVLIKKFNKFNKADDKVAEEIAKKLQVLEEKGRKEVTFNDLFGLLGLSLALGAFFTWIPEYLPQNQYFNSIIWTISLSTLAGIIGAMTPLTSVPGSKQLSNIMLYTLVALIASSANFAELTEAPAFILAGAVILLIHAIVMLIFAKILKIDLFTCCIASCANIGGVASAPIIAGA
uniref:DUF819 family protein n=1 Tax=uncultured Cetobacterium sp. TaxID=527638 RepID=UPI0026107E89